MTEVEITMKMKIDEDFINELKHIIDHHIEQLIDYDNYPEIKTIYDCKLKTLQDEDHYNRYIAGGKIMDEKFYFETDVMSEDEILNVFIPDRSLGENVGRKIPIITKSVFIECYNRWIKESEKEKENNV